MICRNKRGVAIAHAFALAPVFPISYGHTLPSSCSEFGPSTTANSNGVVALLAGPMQFSSRLRQRHLKFHRVRGRIYVISIFIGSFTGIALAVGRPGMPGTSMQTAASIVCTTAAFITARNRQIAQHRQWMARSYAVTFTFVSSRLLNLWPRYWSHLADTFAAVVSSLSLLPPCFLSTSASTGASSLPGPDRRLL
jgi:uncharacterized membrane protein